MYREIKKSFSPSKYSLHKLRKFAAATAEQEEQGAKDCSEIKDTKMNAHILTNTFSKNYINKKLSDLNIIEIC